MADRRWWGSALALVAALAAQPGLAEEGTPGVYPFPVRLRLAPGTAAATYQHPRQSGWAAPDVRPTTVRTGAQVAPAYATRLGRLFAPPAGEADLELVVALADASLTLDPRGWQAAVIHELVLAEPGGAEVARWRVEGRAHLDGVAPAALHAAFQRAAAAAADRFELDLEASEGFTAWLEARGAVRGSARAELLERRRLDEVSRPPPPPRRPASLVFVEGGSTLVQGGPTLSASLALRAGWSGRHLLVQATYDRWPTAFAATPPIGWGPSDAAATVRAMGLDVAWPRRIGNDVEVHLGAGLHLLSVEGTTTMLPLEGPLTPTRIAFDGKKTAVSLLTGARYSHPLPWLGLRLRAGMELRRWLGAAVSLPAVGRDLAAAEWSVAFLLGLEWAAGPTP